MSAQPVDLHPMHDVTDEPVVILSPTGTVMVTRGDHTIRFRTRAAFDADLAAVIRQSHPSNTNGLVVFGQLQVKSQIRVLGEWHWVDHIDQRDQRLLLREVDEPCSRPFWYTPTEGETFVVADPF